MSVGSSKRYRGNEHADEQHLHQYSLSRAVAYIGVYTGTGRSVSFRRRKSS